MKLFIIHISASCCIHLHLHSILQSVMQLHVSVFTLVQHVSATLGHHQVLLLLLLSCLVVILHLFLSMRSSWSKTDELSCNGDCNIDCNSIKLLNTTYVCSFQHFPVTSLRQISLLRTLISTLTLCSSLRMKCSIHDHTLSSNKRRYKTTGNGTI
jgi:hypothetical protein